VFINNSLVAFSTFSAEAVPTEATTVASIANSHQEGTVPSV